MSDLLVLARDYLDRMANPIHGSAVNEDYALRFARLFERDGFEAALADEIRGLRDKDALTSHGWLWIIRWARSRHIDVSEDLLLDLFEEWSSIPAKCTVVDLATYRSELDPSIFVSFMNLPLSMFPQRFLGRLMRNATTITEEELGLHGDRGRDERRRRMVRLTARAESLLVILIQVATPITLAAARTLVRHQWEGHTQLFEFLQVLASPLDAETRNVWSEQLGLGLSRE
jgi:hypothetical protein